VKKRVKNVLKTIGAGLERSHAGEMLTSKQKVNILKSSTGVMLTNKEKANASEGNA